MHPSDPIVYGMHTGPFPTFGIPLIGVASDTYSQSRDVSHGDYKVSQLTTRGAKVFSLSVHE